MAKYTVKVGQNIFDIALSLYGSVEGILDLFVCNPNLSMDSNIKDGDILSYTDNYFEDSSVLDYYKSNKIVPANQIGNIYYNMLPQLRMIIHIDNKLRNFGFNVSGNGNIKIDWGDNSPIENIDLSSSLRNVSHVANNEILGNRKIKFYGDFSLYQIDFSNIPPIKLYVVSPLYVESLSFRGATSLFDIEFLYLADHNVLTNIDLVHTKLTNLTPLIQLRQAQIINLSYSNIKQSVIDQYLISLVKNYGVRRNCTVNLIGSINPTGLYQKPKDIKNPLTGMEAIWVIVNEHKESSGPWKFILTNNTYTI
ncbi:hypothetical protein DWW91_11070 [Parabacteroides sp. AF17-3]|uniref:hypothetical protein n=1 Tax=Parabacteroides sp. AF17-3 TaxID=2293113 RepID=UPI000EFFA83D|nr:hypothetical protein [Parabacteroides sp. AF17-3]RKU69531.1 hypothetical protein DWW91_11070 [Parabacteroides sp. AF17-3]